MDVLSPSNKLTGFLGPDTEKLSSSLAVLAEIFKKMAETSIECYRCFVIILGEYKLEYKYSYTLNKTSPFFAFVMVILV